MITREDLDVRAIIPGTKHNGQGLAGARTYSNKAESLLTVPTYGRERATFRDGVSVTEGTRRSAKQSSF